jgi:uncharacterized membrane protein
MERNKSHVLDSISFAVRSLIDHVRLFVMVLLAGTGIIALVVALIALFNKGLIQSILSSQALQDYQECVGYNCAAIAYQSGASVMAMISSNIVTVIISGVILALFFVGIDLGFKKVALQLHDRHHSSVKEMFSCFHLTPKAVVGWILYALMVWIGWIFFILPGFIALLRFAFFPYFIIDKHAGPIHALKMSWKATQHHVWDLFALWVVMKIIVYLGFMSGIGVILTWPLSTLAYAFFYRKLVGEKGKAEPHFRSAA